MPKQELVHIKLPDQGATYSVMGGNYRTIISGAETEGRFAVIDMLVPPGAGPGPHAHKEINESFYVVSGEVEFKTEAGHYKAGPGAYVEIPFGGAVHCFKNVGQELAHLVCTVMPAGLETFFEEFGLPTKEGIFLPPPPMTDELREKLKALAIRYDQQFFPPDYLDKATP